MPTTCPLAFVFPLLTAAVGHAALLGLDVSHYQGTVNWTSVAASGKTFAFAKVSEGTTYTDAYGASNMRSAAAAGLYIGAYHYAHPDTNTPAAEAASLLTKGNAAGAFAKDGKHLMPTLDLEDGDGAYTGATSLSDWVVKWAIAVQTGLGTTKKPILYVNGNYLSLLRPSASAARLTDHVDLWIASLTTNPPTSISPFSTWSFWQNSWTGTVPGVSGQSDLDQYNGTLATLAANYVIPEPGVLALLPAGAVLCLRKQVSRR